LGWSVKPGVTTLFRNAAGSGINRRLDQSLTSGSMNLLGSYFGGKVRSSVGLSREHWLQSASLATRADPVTNEQRFVAADGVTLLENRGIEKIDAPVFPFADEWSTNQTYGAVWHVLPWASVTAGYFESSQFSDNYGLDLNGTALDPLTGEGSDYSLRLHFLEDRIHFTATYFQTKQENLGSSIDAATQAELNPLLSRPLTNLVDYRDRTSSGWEYQLTTNITRNWTLDAKYGRNVSKFTRFFPLTQEKIAEAQATARSRGLNPESATIVTRQFLDDQDGNASAQRRITASVATRYRFSEGWLKGFTAGVAARYTLGKPWVNLVIAGVEVLPARDTESFWLTNPFFSYSRRFGRTNCTLQLNINNVFDVHSNQGNSYRWPGFTEPRQFVWTGTVAF
jgi:outer membrane receptor for ferric coprogen and ferric-rhodotorulic acid